MLERTCSPLSAMRTFSSPVLPSEPGAPFGQSRISLGKSEARAEAAINSTKPKSRHTARSERLICLCIRGKDVTGLFTGGSPDWQGSAKRIKLWTGAVGKGMEALECRVREIIPLPPFHCLSPRGGQAL